MVYAALFSASLMGSLNGALWMLAFGAGTLPGVVSSALGISALSRIGAPRRRSDRGLVIAGFRFLRYTSAPPWLALCVAR